MTKRLYRSKRDVMICGVCGGIAIPCISYIKRQSS